MAMDNIDNTIEFLNDWESKQDRGGAAAAPGGRVLVGTVEEFFDRIGVAAIKLTQGLKVGDIIEIGTDEEAVRQRISSMQINRNGVDEAMEGDSVGIKLNHKVPQGSSVYKVLR
ncbi:MAG: hypothetical protein KGI00_02395 [Candidatus Micrarchaeota archaeon]|nr:hypothetical protein [Candidatus Micrarchaeota archaeon]MDE1823762.1 hypothetical protein [Candidatus Micrarchaeota archaeon]MDE1849559.1 hypothetical protein [Candidatus Micrarchaeota archaeon]